MFHSSILLWRFLSFLSNNKLGYNSYISSYPSIHQDVHHHDRRLLPRPRRLNTAPHSRIRKATGCPRAHRIASWSSAANAVSNQHASQGLETPTPPKTRLSASCSPAQQQEAQTKLYYFRRRRRIYIYISIDTHPRNTPLHAQALQNKHTTNSTQRPHLLFQLDARAVAPAARHAVYAVERRSVLGGY